MVFKERCVTARRLLEDAQQLHCPLTTNVIRNVDRVSHKLLIKFTLGLDSKVIHMVHEDNEDDCDVKNSTTQQDQGNNIDNDTDGLTDVLDHIDEITKTLNDDDDLDLSDNELDMNYGSPFIDRAKTFNVEELFRGKNTDLNDISGKIVSNDIGDIISKAFKGKDKAIVKKSAEIENSLIAVKNEDTSSTFRDAEEVLKANMDLPTDITFNDANTDDLNDTDSNLLDTFNKFILNNDYLNEKLLESGDTVLTKKHVISKKAEEDSLLREIIPNMTKKDKNVMKETDITKKTKNEVKKPVKNLSKLKEINKRAKLNINNEVKNSNSNKIHDKTSEIEDETDSEIDNESNSKPIFTKPELPCDNKKSELSKEFIKFGADFNFRIFELSKEEQLEELQKKREGALYVSAPYKCEKCAKGFRTSATYENHVKVHGPTYGPFSCEICHSRHHSEARRRRHADTHRFKYCCTQCEFVARTRERAEAHFQWHAGKTFSCQYCGEQFGKSSTHLSHIRLHHPAMCVWCSQCGEAFIGALGLRQHMRRKHLQTPQSDECEELFCFMCRIQFKNLEAFHRHKEVSGKSCHSDLRPCTMCGESFETESALLQHRRSHTEVQCDVCPAWFSSLQSRQTHYVRAHLAARARARPRPRAGRAPPARPAMCELCGKHYHSAAALSYHQRSHTGERPFACSLCPKTFALNHTLQAHIRSHTGERPYQCPRCPRAFLTANNLARHMKTVHLGQRQYSRCAVCRRWLSSPSAARAHLAAHEGRKSIYENDKKNTFVVWEPPFKY